MNTCASTWEHVHGWYLIDTMVDTSRCKEERPLESGYSSKIHVKVRFVAHVMQCGLWITVIIVGEKRGLNITLCCNIVRRTSPACWTSFCFHQWLYRADIWPICVESAKMSVQFATWSAFVCSLRLLLVPSGDFPTSS